MQRSTSGRVPNEGDRVGVFWLIDEEYYPGVITAYIPRLGKYRVEYEDGKYEELAFHHEKWRPIAAGTPPRTGGGAWCRETTRSNLYLPFQYSPILFYNSRPPPPPAPPLILYATFGNLAQLSPKESMFGPAIKYVVANHHYHSNRLIHGHRYVLIYLFVFNMHSDEHDEHNKHNKDHD